MKRLLLSFAAGFSAIAMCAQDASYELPATLSNYGTIQQESGVPFPAANYVTDNPINDGAYIWVPVGSKVMYKNSSAGDPSAFSWVVPGGTTDDATAKNVIVTYSTAGTYNLPTLTATYASGDQTFKYDCKIKVGGKAEFCHSDIREWGRTYALGYAYYNNQTDQYFGGSNKGNVAGWGNLYFFSSPDMFIDGVNIYVAFKPTKFGQTTNVRARIYQPVITNNSYDLMGISATGGIGWLLDGDNIPMANCMTADDGVFVPTSNAGVYSLKLQTPIQCTDHPNMFFTVEGFSYDPNVTTLEDDFALLSDIQPYKALTPTDYSNGLAHNSFGRYASYNNYEQPVSYFGGSSSTIDDELNIIWKTYSFWICPLVRGAETPHSGIGNISVDDKASDLAVKIENGLLTVSGAVDGTVDIYGINCAKQISAVAANGGVIFNTSSLAPGVYVIRAANGAYAKFMK